MHAYCIIRIFSYNHIIVENTKQMKAASESQRNMTKHWQI